jgi:hypothetical protein
VLPRDISRKNRGFQLVGNSNTFDLIKPSSQLLSVSDDGKRFIVRADEKLTAFLELERAVCIHLLTEQV